MKYKKTGREFNMLQDVITHFGKNPDEIRSTKQHGICTYEPLKNKPKSLGCAIGMYLNNKVAEKLDNQLESSIKDILSKRRLKALLPKWMQNMDKEFLMKVQSLHDHITFWSIRGLSKEGKKQVRLICEEHDLAFKQLKL